VATASPRALKVLLVEDNPDHVLLTRTRLAMTRGVWELESAETLAQALTRLQKGGVDAVLLDLVLPDARGIEAVDRMCSEFPDVPVVCLTSFADEAMGMVAVRRGAQDYLVKTQVERFTLDRSLRYAIERARAEQTAARLAAIVESSNDAIVGMTLAGTITSWNAGAETMFGRAVGDVLGQPVSLLVPEDTPARLQDALRRVGGGEHVPPFEAVLAGRDGTRLHAALTVSPIRGGASRIVGASMIARDVSEARRLQEERERLIAELQVAVASVKTLRGLLPLCSACKKVRDDSGYWKQIEDYLRDNAHALISHGICPDCARTLYPEQYAQMFPEKP
jgi:PAS domain S-box-containing protein